MCVWYQINYYWEWEQFVGLKSEVMDGIEKSVETVT